MSSFVQLIRTVLFYGSLASFTILWVSVMFFIIPFVSTNKRHPLMVTNWAKVVIWLLKVTCGVHYQIHGKENIPEQPCVIISNHQSTWETFFLQMVFTPQSQVLKKEILKIPFFGWAFYLLHPIAINRDDPRAALKDVVELGRVALKEQRWVLIFPEGTRTPNGELGKFSRGGVNLAKKAEVNILPVAHNAADHWPVGTWLKTPGTVHLHIGQPIDTSESTAKELNDQTRAWIEERLTVIRQPS